MNTMLRFGRQLGYQQITITAASSLTVPLGTAFATAVPEAQAMRWRDDGTDPTTTVGYPQAVGQEFIINAPAAFRAISQVAAGILNVCYYAGV